MNSLGEYPKELSIEELEKNLLENNFIQVDFECSRELIDTLIFYFFRLIDHLSEESKRLLELDENNGDCGYIKRTKEEGRDSKEFFHYKPLFKKLYNEQLNSLKGNDALIVNQFLEKASSMYSSAKSKIEEILDILEQKYPGTKAKFLQKGKDPNFVLRVLKYDKILEVDDNQLAKPHFDRGACTLAIAESHSGLRLGTCSDDLRQVFHKKGRAIFFPSITFDDSVSGGKGRFKPTYHDVVRTSEQGGETDFQRWAIVFFADPIEETVIK